MKPGDLVALGDRRQFLYILIEEFVMDGEWSYRWWMLTPTGLKHGKPDFVVVAV